MKLIFIFLTAVIFFTGCLKKDIKTQRLECRKEGKSFTTKKVLDYRSGKYKIKGVCTSY